MLAFDAMSIAYNNKPIVNAFSLQINAGDKIILYGKSGSGKTSILKAVLGFVPIQSGTILFRKDQITSDNIHTVRSHIGYVSQEYILGQGAVCDFMKSIFTYKVNSHLRYDEHEVCSKFELFDLPCSVLSKAVSDLSGGERQRIALVSALLLKRSLLLLDEPTSALDPSLKQRVIDYLTTQTDLTVLAVSHDQEWKRSTSTKIIPIGGH